MKDRRHANHRTGWLCGAISFYPCSCSASCWILGVNSSAWWGESKAQTVFGLVMKIKGLSKYRGRNPHGYFHDLPWKVRPSGETLLWFLLLLSKVLRTRINMV